jgi:hypothetical protein
MLPTLEQSTQVWNRSTPPREWARRSLRRWISVSAGAAGLFLLALLALPALRGRMPVYWDLGAFHLPIRDAYARCLRSGDCIDWLAGMHNGVFITGEGEHGPYHPLHLLLYRFLPLQTAFALELFLSFAFLFTGMFLWLRRPVGTAGALLAALVGTFSANNVSHSFHVNYIAVISHLPWLLWLQEGIILGAGPVRRRAAAGTAFLTGSQLLLGHPQVLSYSLLAEVVYAAFLLPECLHQWRALGAWTAAKMLGGVIGSVQVLATLTFLANSNRSSFDPFGGSLPPAHLLQLLVPSILVDHAPGWMLEACYAGAVPLLLAAWCATGLCGRRSPELRGDELSEQRRLEWFAMVLGLLATWLALGKYGGLYQLQTLLPVVGQFRAPARYLNLLDFAVALLAGLGLKKLAARRSAPVSSWQLVAPWLLAIAAVIAAVAFRLAYPSDEGTGLNKRFLTAPVCFVAAAALLTLAARGWALAACALALFAGWDLYHFCLCHPRWGLSVWKETESLPDYLRRAEAPPSPGGRVLNYSWDGMRTLLHGEQLVNGYRGGIEPRKRLNYDQVDALRLSGAAWYREMDYLPPQRIAGLNWAGGGWHRVPQPLPRVRLVSRATLSTDPAADLPRIAIESEVLSEVPLGLEPGPAGKAVLVSDRPGRLAVEVDAPTRQLLVVAESHDPGWRAMIDGQPADIQRINGDFLGCIIDPGQHTVELAFTPGCLVLGRWISLSGLVSALVLVSWGLLPRRRSVAGRV